MYTTEIAKFNMIEQQIRPWEVLDNRVLRVIEKLDREDFIDPLYRGLAYADCQVPVLNGVRMLPPTVEGRLLQALALQDDEHVLEVGSGSGYLGACLASLAAQVKSVDVDGEIIERAQANTARLGITNIAYEQSELAQIDALESYDAIAVTASLSDVPDNLRQALKVGGRLFVICGDSPVMEALLIRRVSSDEWTRQSLFETDLPRLRQA
jgi:protein-L-isoaspartate(D-aspartate) O-methyltransferase